MVTGFARISLSMARQNRINWTTLFCVVIAYQLIGTLWYSNYMFGELWAIGLGKSIEDVGSYGLLTYVIGAGLAYILNIYLANLFIKENIHNFTNAFMRAVKLWGSFFVPMMVPMFLFSGYSVQSALIFSGYTIACLAASAYSITRWPAKR